MATISAEDVDKKELFTFELAEEAGKVSTHNSMFEIRENELFTAAVFDYETNSVLNICIRVSDKHSGTFVQEFTIDVLDVVENLKPIDIQLSKYLIESGTAVQSIVANMVAIDNDVHDTHSFRLYPANGIVDADNDKFEIDGDRLKLNADISTISGNLNIYLRVEDNAGAFFYKALQLEVVDQIQNSAPTAINISNDKVFETAHVGFVVAQISAVDNDQDDQHVFSLVDSSTYPDNAAFIIINNLLKLNTDLSNTLKDSYSIQLKTLDLAGNSVLQVFTIQVIDEGVNIAPSDIVLSNETIAEDAILETVIGELSAVDANINDTHTFELVADRADNTSFIIDGTSLKLNSDLDYDTQSSYSIRIRVSDAAGTSFEKEFTIELMKSTGIDKVSQVECTMYPNPVTDALFVKCPGITGIIVYDATGSLILVHRSTDVTSEVKLNFSEFKNGLYFVRVELENKQVITQKVIK